MKIKEMNQSSNKGMKLLRGEMQPLEFDLDLFLMQVYY